MNDLHQINDEGSAAVMISRDFSAAFDCIDHEILKERLEVDFGVSGNALSWISSFLENTSQSVTVGDSISSTTICRFGVPRGSVLGPILFSLYTSPLRKIIEQMGARHGTFADDVNIISAISESNRDTCGAVRAASTLLDWYIPNALLPY